MKVLGINGSHRSGGNTQAMVERVLESCRKAGLQTQLINLAEKEVNYCKDCDLCREKFSCSIEDDAWDIIEAMGKADAIVVGSPTYFGSVTGKLKALFDRTLPLRRNGMKLAGKVGAALAVGGSRNGGQEYTISDIQHWMMIHEMTLVGDKTTAHFGGICVGRKPGDTLKDETGMKTVDNTAEKIIEVLKQNM